MDEWRFGRKIKLPATRAIKHQLCRMMAADEIRKLEAELKAIQDDGDERRGPASPPFPII